MQEFNWKHTWSGSEAAPPQREGLYWMVLRNTAGEHLVEVLKDGNGRPHYLERNQLDEIRPEQILMWDEVKLDL